MITYLTMPWRLLVLITIIPVAIYVVLKTENEGNEQ